MRVLMFVRSLDFGGAERQAMLIAGGLARRGHAVKVATLYEPGPLAASLAGSGAVVEPLGGGARAYARLIQHARAADVVYSLLPAQNLAACVLKPLFGGTPLVTGVRAAFMDLDRYSAKARLVYRLEVPFSRMADRIIANSEAGRAWALARGMLAGRLTVVPNGIDTERFRPDPSDGAAFRDAHGLPTDAPLVGLVNRLDVMKDHPTFLRAAAEVAAARPDVRFVCVGDGPAELRQSLQSMAAGLGLADRLAWLPALTAVERAWRALDVSVLSSSFGEGFPNSVGEAMACGVPCAVTDVGDAALVVDRTGAVAPPGDPRALAQAIDSLLGRLERDAPATRAAARDRIVRAFGIDALLDRTETVLREVLG